MGYQRLSELGALYPKNIVTCGGGAINDVWQTIRQRITGANVQTAMHNQACYGSALIAKNELKHYL
jgi:sugar (pentulose or hexulose) kinase